MDNFDRFIKQIIENSFVAGEEFGQAIKRGIIGSVMKEKSKAEHQRKKKCPRCKNTMFWSTDSLTHFCFKCGKHYQRPEKFRGK